MRMITDVISDIRGGKVTNYASELLQQLVLAVEETNKGGSITITLKVKPDKTDENMITIDPVVDVKMPKRDLSGGIFFFDEAGNVTRTDPKQTEMALSAVKGSNYGGGGKFPGVTGDQLGREVPLPAATA